MRLGTLEIASEAAYSLYTPFPIRCNNTIPSHLTLDYPSTTFDNPRRTVDFFHKLFSSLLTPPCRSISGHSSINLSTLSKPRMRLGFLPPSALESALAWSFNSAPPPAHSVCTNCNHTLWPSMAAAPPSCSINRRSLFSSICLDR